jgi:hypothetical protein
MRKEISKGPLEGREDLWFVIEARFHGGAKVIRRTASAEGQSVVLGALPVDDQVTIIGEGFAMGQSGLSPEFR